MDITGYIASSTCSPAKRESVLITHPHPCMTLKIRRQSYNIISERGGGGGHNYLYSQQYSLTHEWHSHCTCNSVDPWVGKMRYSPPLLVARFLYQIWGLPLSGDSIAFLYILASRWWHRLRHELLASDGLSILKCKPLSHTWAPSFTCAGTLQKNLLCGHTLNNFPVDEHTFIWPLAQAGAIICTSSTPSPLKEISFSNIATNFFSCHILMWKWRYVIT